MKATTKIAFSIASGLLLSLSWPEIGGLAPLVFVAFVPLFIITTTTRVQEWKSIFLYSFLSFLLWHIISDYWMLYSTVVGSLTAWIINSFIMAAVITSAFYSERKIKIIPFEIIMAFYWLSFEIMHLFWDLSWPWMNLGSVFANNIEWIQWYEYLGVYGGAFWVIIVNGLFYRLIICMIKKQYQFLLKNVLIVVFSLTIPLAFSYYLLNKEFATQNQLSITVVQPNFDTYTEKFEGIGPLEQSEKMLVMIENLGDSIDLCVLPETAIPENIDEKTRTYPSSIELFLEKSRNSSYPILGSYYSHDSSNSYNTAALFENGKIEQFRHKSKLVPFAETMPFEYITKGLESIVRDEGGAGSTFSRDEFARVFSIEYPKQAKVGTLICFESVFPDIIAEMVRNGAEFLTIITNDDWWFDTPGHRQHFAFARIHAIANRRPIARAANTGISGFIDAYGHVLQESQYREETILSQTLISPAYQTFFSHNEARIRLFIFIVSGLLFLATSITRIK